LVGLFYTSGTTGGSKGVMLTHRNVCASAMYITLDAEIDSDRIWLHTEPMFHLGDQWAVYCVTPMGGSHAFLKSFDAEEFLRTVERYRVTSTLLVPTLLNAVVKHSALDRYDTSSLRTLM
jgi:long-chain acyl-CoA synthetase